MSENVISFPFSFRNFEYTVPSKFDGSVLEGITLNQVKEFIAKINFLTIEERLYFKKAAWLYLLTALIYVYNLYEALVNKSFPILGWILFFGGSMFVVYLTFTLGMKANDIKEKFEKFCQTNDAAFKEMNIKWSLGEKYSFPLEIELKLKAE